jgi:hypothetical protein
MIDCRSKGRPPFSHIYNFANQRIVTKYLKGEPMINLSELTNDAQKYRDALSAIGQTVIRTCSSFDRIEHAWESNYDLTSDDIDILIRIINEITETVISSLARCGNTLPTVCG